MSDVDRNQVFETTRVRTTLKNDGSWIQKSGKNKEQDTASDSANRANTEVTPPQKDVQLEGSTVETADDTKHQAPTEEIIKNSEALPEISVADEKATLENERKSADIAVYQSKVKHNETNVPADVNVEQQTQSDEAQQVSSTQQNPGAASHVESTEQPAASTKAEINGKSSNTAVDQSKVKSDQTEVPADVNVEQQTQSDETQQVSSTQENPGAASSPNKSNIINAPPGEEAFQKSVDPVPELLAKSASESPTHSAGETVEAVVQDNVEPLPEASADATGDKFAPQKSMEPVPNLVAGTVSESRTQPDAETAVESVSSKVQPAPSAGPILLTRAEEEAQADDNAIVEKSFKQTSESFVEPVTASDTETTQNKSEPYRAIELTDALVLEPPTDEAAPEPLKETKQSTKETNQQSDNTNNSEKPVEEQQSPQTPDETRDIQAVCSFCDKIIDGKIKLIISEPPSTCHPECLKCGVCAKALGDLLTPMFLYNQVIQCDGCFAKL